MEFEVIRNDICKMKVNAIVLPANPLLEEGHGTSKAIFEKAGRRKLTKACKEIRKRYNYVRVGTAVPTLGFNLDAKYIIHAVTPKWKDGNSGEYGKLSSAYLSSLELADIMGCESMAFPLLAAGNNRFELDSAIKIAIDSISNYEATNKLNKVFLVVYGMRATDKIKKMGIEMTELIDQAYVLANNERVQPLGEKILDKGGEIACKWGDYALEKAMNFLDNPKNLDVILKKGNDIALQNGLDKIAGDALRGVVEGVVKEWAGDNKQEKKK